VRTHFCWSHFGSISPSFLYKGEACSVIFGGRLSVLVTCWADLGGQAEFLRIRLPTSARSRSQTVSPASRLSFLSDIFPTGYMAAENAQIQDGDTVAIWGCGPVGQFAIRSALMLGAGRVVAIDEVPERLAMAQAEAPRPSILPRPKSTTS
jgi:threonine dehydrogenase-like Zn-dependent dehydrogenase